MEYIPSFEESIPMLLVEGSTLPLLMSEIKGEIKEIEKRLSSLAENNETKIQQISGNVDGNEKMKVELETGTYLVEGSLLIMSNYGGGYDEEYDEMGNYVNQDNYQEFKFNGYLQTKIIVYSNSKVSK